MVRGSYKLDLKRDDARTLMLKMDARLTYAGRERNVAYQLEGKRELRQLESTLRLLNADLNRAQKKIQKRIDFFQTLQKQNKERRQMREIAWCEEEENEWERETRAARRRKMLPKIEIRENHKAEVVGSVRRDQKREYANKMARESHLNRSLNALSKSYAEHRTLTERNRAKLEELQGEDGNNIPIKPTGAAGEPKISRTKTAPGQMSLPQLLGKMRTDTSLQSVPQSHKIVRLPGVNTGHEGTPALYSGLAKKKPNEMVGSFYMSTSTAQHDNGTAPQRRVFLVDPTLGSETAHHRADSKRSSKPQVSNAKPSTKRPKPLSTLVFQQNTIPLRFYEQEKNPFDGGDTIPALNRSMDLINADKDDELYIWLGLESEEELERLRRGELVLQQFDGDNCSDAISNDVP
ncbi:uncharacterized protein LOC117297653 [Asterias rubens]|uniref:uncharacterized protein LOC117297653 n=1 Tax=Asterias rubens TaxID=7604 RepID=UPI0014559BFD|nr:uncharacterized protein LOC117297653 [Asterias rubens]